MAKDNKRSDNIFSDIDAENITHENIDEVIEKIKQKARARAAESCENSASEGSGPISKICLLGLSAILCLTVAFFAADKDNSDDTVKTDNNKTTTHTIKQAPAQEKNEEQKDDNSIWNNDGGSLVPGTPGIVPGVSLF